jgi:hypothetical protein
MFVCSYLVSHLGRAGTACNNNNNNNGEKTESPTITCLPTIYKTITSIISKRIQQQSDDRNLAPKGQKGYCRGSKGYKDQLLISKAILQECKCRKKNVCMTWIDYQKSFDSV